MRPTRDIALRAGIYLTAAISGLAAAYVFREWIHHLWDAPTPNDEKPSSTHPDAEPPSVTSDTEHTSVQSLDTDDDTHPTLPPPRSDAQASYPSSMTTQTVFASLNADDGVEEEDAAQPLVDVLSPHPPRVISKRRSMRAHDLFAESHISFSELGSLVAPQDEPE